MNAHYTMPDAEKTARQKRAHSIRYDKLCEAAEFFGLELQMDKLVEELGELLTLVGRMNTERVVKSDDLESEIADVYNMLDQICILMDCEERVQSIAEQKMKRVCEKIERTREG